MKQMLAKCFTPWRCEAYFDDTDEYFGFLLKRNRALNAVRVALFAAAFLLLMIGYAGASEQPYYYLTAGVLAIALGVSLIIAQNEKQLPKELRPK